MKEVHAPNCGRENDLIAFLYGELNNVDAQNFRRHLRDCGSCEAEVMALREVRDSVVTWRNESLGAVIHPVTDRPLVSVGRQRPSALVALRAFFDFAPLWMKGAVAFAAILFCLAAGLAITNWRTQQPAVTIANSGAVYSQQEFNAAVERRVQEELDRQKYLSRQTPPSTGLKNHADRIPAPRGTGRGAAPLMVQNQKARRPLSKSEREQLAADLRLVSGKNDGDFDLLGDRINQ